MTVRIGNCVVIGAEPEGQCEVCYAVAELRPYGPNRKRICWQCMEKSLLRGTARFHMVLWDTPRREAIKLAIKQVKGR